VLLPLHSSSKRVVLPVVIFVIEVARELTTVIGEEEAGSLQFLAEFAFGHRHSLLGWGFGQRFLRRQNLGNPPLPRHPR
jgi:hypothetical protein